MQASKQAKVGKGSQRPAGKCRQKQANANKCRSMQAGRYGTPKWSKIRQRIVAYCGVYLNMPLRHRDRSSERSLERSIERSMK